MKVARSVWVDAPPEAIWRFVSDPGHYLHFMDGITRWEVEGRKRTGLGARYRVLMHVGSAEIGGLVEVVEHVPNRELAWASVIGTAQRGRWRIRPHPTDEHRTRVELRIGGNAGGGLIGQLAGLVAQPAIARHVRRSLRELRRQVEHEQERAEHRRRSPAPRRAAGQAGR
jgi:carbon monoxide dehydrogenase subunit G